MAKAARKKSTVPADETKADKFRRIASVRVSKALKAIENIGNLSGRSYEYTADQTTKIADALNVSVAATVAKFSVTEGGAKAPAFTL